MIREARAYLRSALGDVRMSLLCARAALRGWRYRAKLAAKQSAPGWTPAEPVRRKAVRLATRKTRRTVRRRKVAA